MEDDTSTDIIRTYAVTHDNSCDTRPPQSPRSGQELDDLSPSQTPCIKHPRRLQSGEGGAKTNGRADDRHLCHSGRKGPPCMFRRVYFVAC